ncbi:hypothetical protein HYDPIDRAFT_110347 [Hydnomerulius pinastri MD-312]|nr:hypothetical protein HYDPIDRAFT_110347 [Hydnomerulius pinastri MD-312]
MPGGIAHLTVPDSYGGTIMRRMLLGGESIYFPIIYGSPGLMLSSCKELVSGPRIWSCFAPTPDITSKEVVYMGEYKLRSVDTMSVEEYAAQRSEAKKRMMNVTFNSKKGKSRKAKKDAFTSGEEKVHVVLMEFVSYDTEFADYIRGQYRVYVPCQGKKTGGASHEGAGSESAEED